MDELIELYKEDRDGRRAPHPPPTPSSPSMHTPSGDPSPTIPVLPPPSPSPCPVEEEVRTPNGGHRIATKQLSEPFARLRPCSAILVLPSEGSDPDPSRAPRALGYASSTGALGSTATEAEKTAAGLNVKHAQTNPRGGSQNPKRCAPLGSVKADGFARYHVRCPDSTQRLQETVALSNGSRLSVTSESLASEDENGSIVIDCSFPAPESCVV